MVDYRTVIDMVNAKGNTHPICLIPNPTLEMKMATVLADGLDLRYIKEQTYDLCLAAVRNNGFAIQFVDPGYWCHAIFREAITRTWRSITYIPPNHCTRELYYAAVEISAEALNFLPYPDEEIIRMAIVTHPDALRYITNPSLEHRLLSVMTHEGALRYVKDQTPEICVVALLRDERSVDYISSTMYEPDSSCLNDVPLQ